MPVNKTDSVGYIYRPQVRFSDSTQEEMDAPQTGVLHEHVVKPTVSPNFTNPWTIKGRPICNNWREVRNFFSSCVGTLENATYYVAPTDSYIAGASKIIAGSAYPFLLHNFNFKGWTSRVAGALKNLDGLKLINLKKQMPWYNASLFTNVCRAPTMLHGGWAMTLFLKRAYDIAYDIGADIKCDKERQEMQHLLKDYDPVRRCFIDPVTKAPYHSEEKLNRLKELVQYKTTWNTPNGGNVFRSRKQRVVDTLATMRDNFGTCISTGMPNVIGAVSTSTSLTSGANLFGGIGHTYVGISSMAKSAVQMSAISNIEHARLIAKAKVQTYKINPDTVKVASTNRLIEACANRMIQERAYVARSTFWQGVFFSMSGLSVALSFGGVTNFAQIGTSLVSMLGLTVVNAIATGFERIHSFKLARRRDDARKEFNQQHLEIYNNMTEEQKIAWIGTMDTHDKIALLELHLHDKLRNGTQEEQTAVFRFFQHCGISNNTIKGMMLAKDPAKSLATMRTQMYASRTKHSFDNSQMMFRTFGYVSGVTYMHRYRKGGETDLTDEQIAKYLKEDEIEGYEDDDVVEEESSIATPEYLLERENPFKKSEEEEENQVKPLNKAKPMISRATSV